jgi:hypothetical protein
MKSRDQTPVFLYVTEPLLHPWRRVYFFSNGFEIFQLDACNMILHSDHQCTGTPPLTRFFGPRENRGKGKPRYRRSTKTQKRGICKLKVHFLSKQKS